MNETVEDYKLYSEFIVSVYLWKFFPPLLIVFGTIGNVLSIIVLRRPNIRRSSCSIYFVLMSVSDISVLYVGLLRQWINNSFKIDIRELSSASCKIHTWLVYSCLDFSSWILVAVTIERTFVVCLPLKANTKCTKSAAVSSALIIALCLLLVNSHILYGYQLNVTNLNESFTTDDHNCDASKIYEEFWNYTYPIVDFTLFCGVPFLFLLVGNILIFHRVLQSKRSMKSRHIVNNNSSQRKRRSKFSSMSIMLLVVNTMFLVCNTPISIYLVGYNTWRQNVDGFERIDDLLWSIVNFLQYLNNSINFLLYIVSGSRFRNELKLMICGKRQQRFFTNIQQNGIAKNHEET